MSENSPKSIKKVAIITNNMQCSSNKQYFSSIERYFDINGWSVCEDFNNVDMVVFSACGYHNDMFDLVKSSLDKLRTFAVPEESIVMVGCLTKTHEDELKKIFNGRIINFKEEHVLDEMIKATTPFNEVKSVNIFKFPVKDQTGEKDDLFHIKIVEGCMKQCTYCVINKAHGDIRSESAEKIEEQFRQAIAQGYKKISLLATDTFAYGYDRGENPIDLIEHLLSIEPGVKFYFGNLHVRWLRDYQEGILSLCKRGVFNFLHVSMQHVNNRILESMGRAYDFAVTYSIISKMKQECPNLFILVDIIVGFPGETDEEFAELRDFVKNDKCINMIIHNRYSDIPGAPSSKFKDKIPEDKKVWRYQKLKAVMGDRYPSVALEKINENESQFFKFMFERQREPGGFFFCKDTYGVV